MEEDTNPEGEKDLFEGYEKDDSATTANFITPALIALLIIILIVAWIRHWGKEKLKREIEINEQQTARARKIWEKKRELNVLVQKWTARILRSIAVLTIVLFTVGIYILWTRFPQFSKLEQSFTIITFIATVLFYFISYFKFLSFKSPNEWNDWLKGRVELWVYGRVRPAARHRNVKPKKDAKKAKTDLKEFEVRGKELKQKLREYEKQ